jgi:drug/metabolite transporter (DMT)-like permease
MLAGGAALLAVSAAGERWPEAHWTGGAVGSIAYLAIVGSAVPFVVLTILLRELPAVTVSYITLVLPFGALGFGAAIDGEPITLAAVAGAALVASGLLVAQWPARRRVGQPPARLP